MKGVIDMSEEMYNYFLNFMYKAGALQKVIEEEEQHGKQKATN